MIFAEVFSVPIKRRSLVGAFATLAVVSACSSSSSPASSSSTEGADSGASTDASTATATWTFGGGTTTSSFNSGVAPALVTIPAGGDVTASIGLQFGAPSESGSLTFSSANNQLHGEATNDVSPPTLPTDDAPPTSADPESGAINNPVLYLSIFNPGPSAISFAEAPSVAIAATGDLAAFLSGDVSCQLDLYLDGAWIGTGEFSEQGQALPASFTIPAASIPKEATLSLPPGQTLAAIGCD